MAVFEVKLDESPSPLVAAPLLDFGYAVRTVRGQGWAGTKDIDLWPLVRAERIFFVTADKGFGDVRLFIPGTHAGILVLRPHEENLMHLRQILFNVALTHPLETLRACVTVASERSVQIRRPQTVADEDQLP